MAAIDALRDVAKIQCSSGNWDYDPYMQGMANGLILALSIMEDSAPQFLKAPEVWLRDLPESDVPPVACSGGEIYR